MGVRARLCLLLLLAFLPVAGFVAVELGEHRRQVRRLADDELLRLARIASAEHKRLLQSARETLILLVGLPAVQQPDPGACSAVAAAALTQFPRFANIAAAHPDGTLFCSAIAPAGPVNLADRPYFRRALDTHDFVVSEYLLGRVTGQATVTVALASRDARGRATAVGLVAVGLGWLDHLAGEAGLPQDAAVAVFDGQGRLLARHPLLATATQALGQEVPLVREALARGGEATLSAVGYDGISRVYAVTPLPGTATGDVYLAVGFPERLVYAAARRLAIREVLTVTGLAGLVLGIVWVAGGALLVRPIGALTAAATRLGQGELGARPNLRHDGSELGRLARAFDEMAERLSILHDIDRAIIAADSAQDIAVAALGRLRPLLDASLAVVATYDLQAGTGRRLAVAGRGETALAVGGTFPLSMMGDLDALRRGEAQLVDATSLSGLEAARVLLAEGVHRYLVVPLLAGGELIGSLNFSGDWPDGPPADRVQIAREVAAQLATALAQAQLREAVKRHAAELEARVRERTAELHAANAGLREEVLERRQAEEAAARASQAKSEFLSRMSHELRTPLNAVLGFAQLLEMDRLNEAQQESVHHILRAGRHLLTLINEILDLARIEAGRISVSPEPVQVGETLRAALDLVQPLAAERNVRLEIAPGAADGRFVLADHQRLQQVLLNLLSNAIKYNRDGGSVTVACETPVEGRLRMRVTDTGHGIAPDMLGRLFQPFERLGADRLGVEGTGLGLALARGLVEAMGGTLGVESRLGVGSTFWIELPLTEEVGPAVGAPEAPPAAAPGAPAAGASAVLYIEDNLSNVRLLERSLAGREGLRFLTAMQGRLGVDLATQHRPGVILLDLHLPDIDGEEVLRLLRADARTRAIPVIVMSADATASRVRRLTEAGAWAYVTKPLDVRRTLALIDRALGGETPDT